jgi:addiction module HigA family antidote
MARHALHPGKLLAKELDALGITLTAFARDLEVPPNRISQILNGKRAITGDTALRLAHWFRNDPEFWLNLQTAYDLKIAEQASGSLIKRLPRRPQGAKTPANDARIEKIIRSI